MYIKQKNEQVMSNKYKDSKKHRGITVEVRNDDFGKALRTWSKKVQDSGLLKELKDRMAYEKPAVEKQRMRKQARKIKPETPYLFPGYLYAAASRQACIPSGVRSTFPLVE